MYFFSHVPLVSRRRESDEVEFWRSLGREGPLEVSWWEEDCHPGYVLKMAGNQYEVFEKPSGLDPLPCPLGFVSYKEALAFGRGEWWLKEVPKG